jgi:Ricin-type beta-trefoil lectin domain-like
MTGPQRRARHQRSRAPRAWVFGTAGVAAALAAIGVVVMLLTSGSPAASPTPLATDITSSQAVGLANLGPLPAGTGPAGAETLLSRSQARLTFTPSGGGDTVQPGQQWQADQMGGGAYVLVFTPDGQCLTAAATSHGATARLAHCALGLSQRWAHPYLGTDRAGRGYWQLRSAADGRCIAVSGPQSNGGAGVAMQPCSSSMAWQQLINFVTPF